MSSSRRTEDPSPRRKGDGALFRAPERPQTQANDAEKGSVPFPEPLRPAYAAARDEDIDIEWDGTVTGQVKTQKRQAPGSFTFVRAPGGIPEAEIYVRPQVIAEAMKHAKEMPDREIGGLLIGELCDDPDLASGHFVRVLRTIRFKAVGSSAHLKIEGGVLQDARDEARREGLIDVGWYHSHPNWGIFLSETDHTQFQDSHFNKPWHVALVVDPRRNEHGFFMRTRGGDGRAERADFFYLWEEGEDRSFPVAGPTDTGPAADEPSADQAAREEKLAMHRRALNPDSKEDGLKLVTSKTALVKFKNEEEERQLTPEPCFTGHGGARAQDRSRPAVSVVIAESDLADKEEKLKDAEREMGFLLGRFGKKGNEEFAIVKDFAVLKDSDKQETYAKMLDSTELIARAAADTNRRLKSGPGKDMRVVGWYYRSPGPADAIPEDHMPVISDVFPDHRFITLAFFAGASDDAKPPEDGELQHQVFVTHGEFQWRSPAPIASLDLISTGRKKVGAALAEAARGGVQMAFVDEPQARGVPLAGDIPPGAVRSEQRGMYRSEEDQRSGLSDLHKGILLGAILVLAIAGLAILVITLVSGAKNRNAPAEDASPSAPQQPASKVPATEGQLPGGMGSKTPPDTSAPAGRKTQSRGGAGGASADGGGAKTRGPGGQPAGRISPAPGKQGVQGCGGSGPDYTTPPDLPLQGGQGGGGSREPREGRGR